MIRGVVSYALGSVITTRFIVRLHAYEEQGRCILMDTLNSELALRSGLQFEITCMPNLIRKVRGQPQIVAFV
jgi:hypothetical protein